MRYLVIALLEELDSDKKSSLSKIIEHGDDLLIPDVDGVGSSYLYIKESEVPTLYSKIKNVIQCVSLHQYVSSDEVLGFISRLEDAERIVVGDHVKITGYGDMVFVVTGNHNHIFEVSSVLRNKRVIKKVKRSQLKKHKESSYFIHTEVEPSSSGYIVLDVDYVVKCPGLDPEDYVSIINFILRVKLQVRRRKICFSFLGEPFGKFKDIVNIFGLGYSTDYIASGDYLFSDKKYYLSCFPYGILSFNKSLNQIVLHNEGNINLTVPQFSFLSYCEYFDSLNLLPTTPLFSSGLFIERCRVCSWEDIVERYLSYYPLLKGFFTLPNTLVDPVSTEFKESDMMSFLKDNKMVWFLENRDYYLNVIRG